MKRLEHAACGDDACDDPECWVEYEDFRQRIECLVPGCHTTTGRFVRGICVYHYDRWLYRRPGSEVIDEVILPPYSGVQPRVTEKWVCECPPGTPREQHKLWGEQCAKCHRLILDTVKEK